MPPDQVIDPTTSEQQPEVEQPVERAIGTDDPLSEMHGMWDALETDDAGEEDDTADTPDDQPDADAAPAGEQPAGEDTPRGDLPDAEGEEKPGVFKYIPDLPEDLFTKDEEQQIIEAYDSMDARRIAAANVQISLRTAQYVQRAEQVTQTHVAQVPQTFMNVHGPAVMEFLNSLAPNQRGSKEAIDQAMNVAIYKRAQVVGPAKAYEEAARLLSPAGNPSGPTGAAGAQEQPVTTPAPAARPAVVEQRPEDRFPSATSLGSGERARGNGMTRTERGVRGVLNGLGIED